MTDSNDKLNSLRQAVQLTQTMLAMAQQKQWNDLPEIENKRRILLQSIFPLDEDSPEIVSQATVLQTLIDTNNELIAHCQEGKQSLQLQMRDAKFTHKAVTAYQSN
ncbi:flagellar protein FliT [Methylophaga sp.]|uniref:flagellar protein FliT n=1 Tax=Methylophaga sp. TaxID=2024840 RepID=UPI0025DF4F1C|nr:flagellar protein FliT [Methylophaga sp.]